MPLLRGLVMALPAPWMPARNDAAAFSAIARGMDDAERAFASVDRSSAAATTVFAGTSSDDARSQTFLILAADRVLIGFSSRLRLGARHGCGSSVSRRIGASCHPGALPFDRPLTERRPTSRGRARRFRSSRSRSGFPGSASPARRAIDAFCAVLRLLRRRISRSKSLERDPALVRAVKPERKSADVVRTSAPPHVRRETAHKRQAQQRYAPRAARAPSGLSRSAPIITCADRAAGFANTIANDRDSDERRVSRGNALGSPPRLLLAWNGRGLTGMSLIILPRRRGATWRRRCPSARRRRRALVERPGDRGGREARRLLSRGAGGRAAAAERDRGHPRPLRRGPVRVGRAGHRARHARHDARQAMARGRFAERGRLPRLHDVLRRGHGAHKPDRVPGLA